MGDASQEEWKSKQLRGKSVIADGQAEEEKAGGMACMEQPKQDRSEPCLQLRAQSLLVGKW